MKVVKRDPRRPNEYYTVTKIEYKDPDFDAWYEEKNRVLKQKREFQKKVFFWCTTIPVVAFILAEWMK